MDSTKSSFYDKCLKVLSERTTEESIHVIRGKVIKGLDPSIQLYVNRCFGEIMTTNFQSTKDSSKLLKLYEYDNYWHIRFICSGIEFKVSATAVMERDIQSVDFRVDSQCGTICGFKASII